LKIDRSAKTGLRLVDSSVEPAVARAGERGTWAVSFAGLSLVPGARIRLRIVGGRWNKGDCTWPQVSDPAADDFVSASASNGAELNLEVPSWRDKVGTLVDIYVGEPGISEETVLTVTLGDTSGGGEGMVLNSFSMVEKVIDVLIDNATGEWVQVENPPTLQIIGGIFDRLSVLAPGTVHEGEEFDVLLKAEDAEGNVAPAYEASVELSVSDGDLLGETHVTIDEGAEGLLRVEGLKLQGEGVVRLIAHDEALGMQTVSNPIRVVSDEDRRLLWGSIHGHTALSDGTGTPEAYYETMRDHNRLDFGAIADHDHVYETSDEMWEYSRRVTAQFNEPDRFVAFPGYEWAKWRRNGDADRCVYYVDDHAPMYRSDEGHCATPPELFEALSSHDALIIPHHTASRGNFCDWKDHEPERERLVEIYSVWGSSECAAADGNPFPVRPVGIPDGGVEVTVPIDSGEEEVGFVQNALLKGWRVGFTGGGDDHHGHAGDPTHTGSEPFRYRDGLLGVWADQLDRRSIFEALNARRCYATTGARMVAEFTVGEFVMGTDIQVKPGDPLLDSRSVWVRVSGTAPISRIEIVRNNEVVHQQRFEEADAELHWFDTDGFDEFALAPEDAPPFGFYYVRVLQADGQMAWLSPVWLTLAEEE